MTKAVLYLISLLLIIASSTGNAQTSGKKLIEFGWDYPTVEYLKKNISQMERAPFDGVVFSFDFKVYDAFDTLRYPDSVFQFYQLTKIPWNKFTDNFIFVRGESPNGAQWLNDKAWNNISENLKNVSKAVFTSKAKGILFDPEYYIPDSTKNPWTYSSQLYKGFTYFEVGTFVRKRGRQFMQSLQTYKPGIKILCTWFLGLVAAQNRSVTLQKTGMALYPFFIEGMLEGKNDESEIIDGNEDSYGYTESAHFIWSAGKLKDEGIKYIDPALLPIYHKISQGQAIYLDGLFAKFPQLNKGYDTLTKTRWLAENLYNAFKTTDEYVWFYNEKVNWWRNEIDTGLARIIGESKNRIEREYKIMDVKKPVRKSFHRYDFKKNYNEIREGTATYDPVSNTLNLLSSSLYESIEIYNNSRLVFTQKQPPKNFTIQLKGLYNKSGNLIVLTRQSNKMIGVIFIN